MRIEGEREIYLGNLESGLWAGQEARRRESNTDCQPLQGSVFIAVCARVEIIAHKLLPFM